MDKLFDILQTRPASVHKPVQKTRKYRLVYICSILGLVSIRGARDSLISGKPPSGCVLASDGKTANDGWTSAARRARLSHKLI